jgi:hypothetical protein
VERVPGRARRLTLTADVGPWQTRGKDRRPTNCFGLLGRSPVHMLLSYRLGRPTRQCSSRPQPPQRRQRAWRPRAPASSVSAPPKGPPSSPSTPTPLSSPATVRPRHARRAPPALTTPRRRPHPRARRAPPAGAVGRVRRRRARHTRARAPAQARVRRLPARARHRARARRGRCPRRRLGPRAPRRRVRRCAPGRARETPVRAAHAAVFFAQVSSDAGASACSSTPPVVRCVMRTALQCTLMMTCVPRASRARRGSAKSSLYCALRDARSTSPVRAPLLSASRHF